MILRAMSRLSYGAGVDQLVVDPVVVAKLWGEGLSDDYPGSGPLRDPVFFVC